MAWVYFGARLFVLSVAALVALAALSVLFVRPGHKQNRLLALVLLCESAVFACGEGLMYLTDDPRSTYAFQFVAFTAGVATIGLYVLFLGTLQNPISRALRRRPVVVAAAAISLLASALVIVRPELMATGVHRAPVGYAGVWDIDAGPLFLPVFMLQVLLYLFGLVVALFTYRAASPGRAEAQARYYLLAFGWRDLVLVVSIGAFILAGVQLSFPASVIGAFAYIGFVPLLAYGMLKAQLFDIDLKIKWGIRRGTVVAILGVAFVIVAEVAQNWLSDAYGYLAGGLAAGMLLLALRPLDRIATRVADRAMPGVDATPAYVAYRKMEVYRAAL